MDGPETLAMGASVVAVRAACPGGLLDVCTGVWIEADYGRRVDLVGAWGSLPVEDRPDFAGVNLSEDGAVERCAVLIEAGAGVEAGLWSLEDSQLLEDRHGAERCTRLLIELMREDRRGGGREHRSIEGALDGSGTSRLLRDKEGTLWPMLRYALERGYEARIGFKTPSRCPTVPTP